MQFQFFSKLECEGRAVCAGGGWTLSANWQPIALPLRRTGAVTALVLAGFGACVLPTKAAELAEPDLNLLPKEQPAAAQSAAGQNGGMFLREFRLQGATLLEPEAIERAVYPYLGPGRSPGDVEAARAALQALYHSRWYQSVSVEIPQQKVRRGVVVLRVHEVKVGKVRVRGAKYHEPSQILAQAPSLAEGRVPDFNEVMHDVTALNSTADRRVTPELVPGQEPGTLDVNLVVADSLPLHGGLELNNRNSSGTTALRLNGSLRYDNLWQLGHSVGASFQISPSDIDEVQVYSGFYRAAFKGLEKLSLTLSGTSQNTNISTLGDAVSIGKGYTISLSGNYILPGTASYYNSFTLGVDYKHANQDVVAGGVTSTPINYIPIQMGYAGGWVAEKESFNLYLGSTFHFRGAGSSGWKEWDANRFGADGNFMILRADFAYTRQMSEGLEGYLRLHGQMADSPLISQEQVGGGGMDSVRGYYEGEITSDQAVFGTVELRSDSLPVQFHQPFRFDDGSLKLYLFADGGILNRKDALADEKTNEYLASFGIGARFSLLKYLSAVVNLGVPVIDGRETKAWHPRLTFIIRGDF